MTCALCTHPQRRAIDADLRARAAPGAVPSESFGALARRYKVAKTSLMRHRDECDVRSTTNEPLVMDRTLPSLDRVNLSEVEPIHEVANEVAEIPTVQDVVQSNGPHIGPGGPGAGMDCVGGAGPPPLATNSVSARAREKIQLQTEDEDLKKIIARPIPPSIVTRVEEIADDIIENRWDGHKSVKRYEARWGVSRGQVLDHFRAACVAVKVSRGDLPQAQELSARRWLKLHDDALASDSKTKFRDAAEALKGHDRAIGLVDNSAKVQVNIAQSPQGQDFMRIVFEALRPYPEALAAVRAGLLASRERVGEIVEVGVDNIASMR